MTQQYVHGYELTEALRLQDQAQTLVELLHSDTHYPSGSSVLEAGCGVGAQTVTLAQSSPDAKITSIDISERSIEHAHERIQTLGLTNVHFEQADIFSLPFAEETFDHIFLCFVLEHLPNPGAALECLRSVLKPGGTITVIEGDHGSTYFHPESDAADAAIQCQVELQRRAGGDAHIGRRLYPLVASSGFTSVRVSPRMVYVDGSKPHLIEGFTKKTFTNMIEGIRESALEAAIIEPTLFDQGVRDLHRTATVDGTFSYTFYKAVAEKQSV
ncbi:MAG: methyltransferase domain-containing protein [Pseudomonadota bacterium]